jgi:hypothetical protein
MDDRIAAILETFPFLSYGCLQDTHYLGIIQNSDNQLLSMYVLDLIPDEAQRDLFLKFGESWWWGSNRLVPINIFTKDPAFRQFRPFLKHFARKDFNLISGPSVSLQETIARRVRKRQVTLVRRPD